MELLHELVVKVSNKVGLSNIEIEKHYSKDRIIFYHIYYRNKDYRDDFTREIMASSINLRTVQKEYLIAAVVSAVGRIAARKETIRICTKRFTGVEIE